MCCHIFEVDTCEEIDDIMHGNTTCKHGDGDITKLKVGDYCTFSCSAGMKLTGAPLVKCSQTGWDVVPPHCAGKTLSCTLLSVV